MPTSIIIFELLRHIVSQSTFDAKFANNRLQQQMLNPTQLQAQMNPQQLRQLQQAAQMNPQQLQQFRQLHMQQLNSTQLQLQQM